MTDKNAEVHVVFDGPPSADPPRFVEVETPDGKSISWGRWEQRGKRWHLIGPSPSAPLPQQSDGWIKCSERLPEPHRKLLVTNNVEARDAHGQMSHVWLVRMIHKADDDEGFCAYTDEMTKVHGVTHYRYALPPLPKE